MPIYLDGPVIQRGLALEQFETPFQTYLKAKFDDAWDNNITPLLAEDYRVRTAGQGAFEPEQSGTFDAEMGMGSRPAVTKMPAVEARQKVKDASLNLNIPEDGINSEALDILMKRKVRQRGYEDAIARSPTGMRSVAGIGAQLVAGLLDPLNVASAFVPVVGEARYTAMLARASGLMGRTGVRAGVGAMEGAVGMAMLEPATYAAHSALQDDYKMLDSIINIGFGGVLGGGLHVAGGAFRDVIGGSRRWAKADVVMPEKAGEPVVTKQSPAEEMVTLYHGSPHEFEQFSMDRIGTGEGAQAYGHGLYFAEKESTAAYYKKAGVQDVWTDDVPRMTDAVYKALDPLSDGKVFWGPNRTLITKEKLAAFIAEDPAGAWASLSPGLQKTAQQTLEPPGNLYRVEVPRSVVDRMLDWDKPLSEEQAAAALKALGDVRPAKQSNGYYGVTRVGPDGSGTMIQGINRETADEAMAEFRNIFSGRKGEDAHRLLAGILGGPEQASAALREAGLPGIRYLDAGSRTAGEGSRNVVLFDTDYIHSAQNIVKNATPQQREAALRTAIAQATDGRTPNVTPIFDPNASVADVLRHQASPDSERLADPVASRIADEAIKSEKSLDLKTAQAEADQALAKVEERWAATGRDPAELKRLMPGLDEMTKQADELAAAARAAALCDTGA